MSTVSLPHEELAKVLEEMLGCYRRLSELAAEKKEILITGDAESLAEHTASERELITRIQELEARRQEVLRKTAVRLELDEEAPSLKRLIAELEGKEAAARLQELRGELVQLMDDLGALNEQNEALLRESLEYNEFLLELTSELEKAGIIYGRDGQVDGGDERGYMDSKM